MKYQKQVLSILKEGIKFIILALIISLIIDWWRKPEEPVDFIQEPLHTLSYKKIDLLQQSKDRVSILYFWASWCGYCRRNSPVIEQLRAEGIPVLSIALSSGSNDEIRHYMKQHNLNFETVNDSESSIARRWNIIATPTTVLIKNGKMLHSTSGLSTYWGLRARIALFNSFY